MAITFNLGWKGLKEFDRALAEFPEKFKYNMVLNVLKEESQDIAVRIMKRQLGIATKRRTGNLMRSIGQLTDTQARRYQKPAVLIGARRKKYDPTAQGWHSHLIEYGVKPHLSYSKKGNKIPIFAKGSNYPVAWVWSYDHPGVRPRPFVYRAFQSGALNKTSIAVENRLMIEAQKALMKHRGISGDVQYKRMVWPVMIASQ